MKKLNKLLVILVSLFIFNINVYAVEESSCSNADIVNLGKEAVSIKVAYEEKEQTTKPGEYYPPEGYEGDPNEYVTTINYFNINFMNISENLYIEVTNNLNDGKKIINYSDTDKGIYEMKWNDLSKPVTFNYKIFASKKSKCYLKEIKSGIIAIPAYNPYYIYPECKGNEDYYLCEKYINTSISYNEFIKQLKKHNSQKTTKEKQKETLENQTFMENLKTIYNNHKVLAITITIILSLLILSIIVINVIKIKRRVI